MSGPETGLAMTNTMTALMVAVGGTSLVCYWLMKRVQNGAAATAARLATTPITATAVAAHMIPAAAGMSSLGSTATVLHRTIPARPITPAAAIAVVEKAVAAATAEVVAIRIAVSAEGVLCL